MNRSGRQNKTAANGSAANTINADTFHRAEEAVGKLAEQYREWAQSDIEMLRDLLAKLKAGSADRDDIYDEIRAIVHDMRGQGSTFGYPLITRIARSISCTIKEGSGDDSIDALVQAHIDAMANIVDNNLGGDGGNGGAKAIEVLEAALERPLD